MLIYIDIWNLKKKKYDFESVNSNFSYILLDELFETDPLNILKKEDKDEIYQIYQEYIKLNKKNNLGDFYLWLIQNYCFLIEIFTLKIDRLFGLNNNPFRKQNENYKLNYEEYLFNRKLIDFLPKKSYKKIKDISFDKFLPNNKNLYRLNNSSLRIIK